MMMMMMMMMVMMMMMTMMMIIYDDILRAGEFRAWRGHHCGSRTQEEVRGLPQGHSQMRILK